MYKRYINATISSLLGKGLVEFLLLGASFILYNSARIETLLRTFEDRVSSGVYPKLPDVENIDITLLNDGVGICGDY